MAGPTQGHDGECAGYSQKTLSLVGQRLVFHAKIDNHVPWNIFCFAD